MDIFEGKYFKLVSKIQSGRSPTRALNAEQQVQVAVRERPADYLLFGIWFGLLGGVAEVVVLALSKIFLHRYLHIGIDTIWMTPLADVILFSVLGGVLSLTAIRVPHLVSLRLVVFVYTFLGLLSLLFMFSWLENLAALVLAAGISVQTARLIGARPRLLYALINFTAVWSAIFPWGYRRNEPPAKKEALDPEYQLNRRQFLVSAGAVVAGLAVGVRGWQILDEQRVIANLVPPRPKSPNVLLITLDTVRAQNLSLYGYGRQTTPELGRWSEKGVRFDRALSTAPWTLPSHASLLTGRYPHELSADWAKPLDSSRPTLAEVLSAHGYVTAGFVANTIYLTAESGMSRGFAHYEDYSISPGQTLTSPSLVKKVMDSPILTGLGYVDYPNRKSAQELNQDFLRWLSAENGQRPFFAFLNYFDAHSPYLPPKPFDGMFGLKRPRADPRLTPTAHWSAAEIQAELDAYDGAIAYLDHQLGLLLQELEGRGVLENTLVIITSDHGEEFYEHRVMAHGWSTYLASLHVPLLISFPGRVPQGRAVTKPVTLRDLAATVLSLVGIDARERLPGKSLERFWSNAGVGETPDTASPMLSELTLESRNLPEWYPIRQGDMKSLVIDRYHYIRNRNGYEEFYDFESDPLELHNLAQSESGRQRLDSFRAALNSILAQSDVRFTG